MPALTKLDYMQDWPPTTDFKTAFPELFADFSQAVPVPDYTRRDGILNIASHFATNRVAPDIGKESQPYRSCCLELMLSLTS